MKRIGLVNLIIALVALLALPLTAYAQEPVTITLMVGANAAEFETRKLAIEAFERENPDIKVDLQLWDGGTDVRITRYIGGSSPDVSMEWELEFARFAEMGAYLDLNAFIERDPEFQAYLQNDVLTALVDTYVWNGAQLALPEQYTPVVLFYNKDLFQEAGLTEPPADWSDTSWDWATFLDHAQKITRRAGDGRVERYGYGDMWWTQLSMMIFGWNNGGTWFENQLNPTRSAMSDSNMVDAIQFYADLWNVYEVAPTWPERVEYGTEARFSQGELGMGLTGHWWVPQFNESGINYDVGTFPVGPNGTSSGSDLGSTSLAVYHTTPHPEEAWRLVRFLTGPVGQQVYAESGLFVPVTRTAVEAFLANEKSDRSWIFFTAGEYSQPLPIFTRWGDYVVNAFNPIIHEVMENRASAAQATQQVDEWANAAIFNN